MSCGSKSGNKLAGLFSFAADCGSGCFHPDRGPGLHWSVNEREMMETLFISYRSSFLPLLAVCVSILVCFSLSLHFVRATSSFINLFHSLSPSLLIFAVILLLLRVFFFSHSHCYLLISERKLTPFILHMFSSCCVVWAIFALDPPR